jgi:hypothetical protein
MIRRRDPTIRRRDPTMRRQDPTIRRQDPTIRRQDPPIRRQDPPIRPRILFSTCPPFFLSRQKCLRVRLPAGGHRNSNLIEKVSSHRLSSSEENKSLFAEIGI